MTCKISFIKTILETLKHHIASIFSVCLVFFIQLIVFFLAVQNYSTAKYDEVLDKNYIVERLNELTLPNLGYAVPVVFVAVLLAFDFFRYLHSKKQIDFYESLPVRRKDWFLFRISTAALIYFVPYFLCVTLEVVLLVSFGFFSPALLSNLMWNFACMVCVFLITFFTGVLSMILTGHSVIALFGFCVFSVYAPLLLRYIYPAYASEYFQTYVTDDSKIYYLNYFSPIGLTYKLTHSYYEWTLRDHTIDFIAILIMIVLVGILAYVLFKKRPSEAAGRAMSFTKWNSVIRILIVIPLTLYIGLYLSLVASAGAKIWMIFGFIIGTFLLHGIIESIFQFDICGLWACKRQMILCFIVTFTIALIFWTDFFHYDEYLPALDNLESISITSDGYDATVDKDFVDGISGEYLDDAHLLAQNIIEQNIQIGDSSEHEWIMFQYHLKNGQTKSREYYMNFSANQELFDKIFATKDYKDDICQLYKDDWDNIEYITWSDGVYEVTLYLNEEEKEHLFETYMAEYTPISYSEIQGEMRTGYFTTHGKDDDIYYNYPCYVYSSFSQTISLLEKYLQANESTKNYGTLTQSPLNKYPIQSLEIYCEKAPVTVSDLDKINSVKDDMILIDHYESKYTNIDWNLYYDAGVSLKTPDGIQYISVILPKDIAEYLMQ